MSTINSKYVNGNLVYTDSRYPHRIIDAFGPTVAKFFDDYVQTPFAGADSPAAYTATLVEAGAGESTIALVDGEQGGAILITSDANEDDGLQIQVKGEAFKFVASKPLYFGARLKIDEATQSDFLVGLCITDTTLLGGMSDGAYFRKVDATTAVLAVLEKATVETTAAALTCDVAYHDYEITWDGTTAKFYVDGVQLAAIAQTNLPNTEFLTPSIALLAGQAVITNLTCAWMRCIQLN